MDTINYISKHLACRNVQIKVIRFLQVKFSGQSTSHEIKAYNQFLFADIASFPDNVQIVSDNNAIQTDGHKYGIEEFTGLVTLNTVGEHNESGNYIIENLKGTVQFIQVILK